MRRSISSSTMLPQPSSRRASISRSARRTRSWRRRCTARCIARSPPAKRWIEGGHKGVVLVDPLDLDHHRPRLHRALRDGEVGGAGDDQEPCRRVGTEGHPHRRDRRRGRSRPPGASGQLRPEGRDETWSRAIRLGRTGEHSELADLASFLVSDRAGYINGEMVVIDGGAHLRSSGRRGPAAVDRCAVGRASAPRESKR